MALNLDIYKERLNEAIELSRTDEEVAHVQADAVLCDLLEELGYKKIVDLWEQVDKWYA